MENEKADLKCSISVTQHHIDFEAVVDLKIEGRSILLKLPNIAKTGTIMRLPDEGLNGGDLYVEIKIIQGNWT
ncbi:hypothetical protein [Desulfobacula toluolica]|uniref:Chaperone DnaJ C-terminal domain-containing protein n=1 Tax=Desulfobacula toluolica (strain DSM 7467 / Tol2) TaxID=651182 RepID=K0NNF5_DESTT|nr:hypothetical protein [Desulfobacula toluolica]CCK82180.1 uncharacterized protein TOL2_C40250 [Desulfobacula toluolica Tol2]